MQDYGLLILYGTGRRERLIILFAVELGLCGVEDFIVGLAQGCLAGLINQRQPRIVDQHEAVGKVFHEQRAGNRIDQRIEILSVFGTLPLGALLVGDIREGADDSYERAIGCIERRFFTYRITHAAAENEDVGLITGANARSQNLF